MSRIGAWFNLNFAATPPNGCAKVHEGSSDHAMTRVFILVIAELMVVIASLSCQNAAQMLTPVSVSQQTSPDTTLKLPESWIDSAESQRALEFIEQIEVRKVPNSSEYEFLFAALPNGDNDYSYELYKDIPKPQYSLNSFVVNLADTSARIATQREWESASRIVTKPRMIFQGGRDESSGEIELRGKKFQKVGKYWGQGLLSPRGRWLAIFSYTGEKPPPDFIFGGGSPRSGDVFWEVYDTVTGEKVFDWKASNIKSPASLSHPVLWLDERYLLFPQDVKAQDFVVVTLPKFVPETNPVTVQLPSRKNEKGEWIPAASRHEVWAPLVALTPERIAEISKPQPTELSEVRLSSQGSRRELLLAILDLTENRSVHRTPGRDGPSDYNLRVFSTYYYAVSLDYPTQARFASKEEWDRIRVSRRSRTQISLDETMETTGGRRPAYRPFPKIGASWGKPQALGGGEWIAIFSYTQQTTAKPAGKMFVDIFETRSGNHFLTSELPYKGSPSALFDAAIWNEGGYLIVPLNESIDSIALWSVPAGIS